MVARARFLLVLFVSVLFGGGAAAGEPVAFGEGLLWRVEKAGAPPSHIFGTVHVGGPEILDLPPEVARVVDGASNLSLEIVLDAGLIGKSLFAMMFDYPRTLDRVLDPALFAQVQVLARDYGWSPRLVKSFKPWAMALVFSYPAAEVQRAQEEGAALFGGSFLDLDLQERFVAQGKPVTGLETVAEQLAVFDGMPEPQQIEWLRHMVEHHDELEHSFDEMLRLYLERNTGGLLTMMRQVQDVRSAEDAAAPGWAALWWDRLIDSRNLRMVERMAGQLQRGNAFIAVGAAHLPGENGILRLLEKQGYRITRVY